MDRLNINRFPYFLKLRRSWTSSRGNTIYIFRLVLWRDKINVNCKWLICCNVHALVKAIIGMDTWYISLIEKTVPNIIMQVVFRHFSLQMCTPRQFSSVSSTLHLLWGRQFIYNFMYLVGSIKIRLSGHFSLQFISCHW